MSLIPDAKLHEIECVYNSKVTELLNELDHINQRLWKANEDRKQALKDAENETLDEMYLAEESK